MDGVWDHPIDVHLGVPSMVGWPRLALEVWSRGEGMRVVKSEASSNYVLDEPEHEVSSVVSNVLSTPSFATHLLQILVEAIHSAATGFAMCQLILGCTT